jgi:hypothetical protein
MFKNYTEKVKWWCVASSQEKMMKIYITNSKKKETFAKRFRTLVKL